MTGRAQQPGGKTWANLMVGDWADEAACAGQNAEWWFPAEVGRRRTRYGDDSVAKRICNTCPVLEQCLTHALTHDETDGVWGGLSPEERAELRKARLRPMAEMDHGTEAGEKKHRRRGEEPCNRCRVAASRAQRERKARRRHGRTNVC